MNIFYLDKDPVIAAQMHCDKHVVKMILETAQLLCTAHRVLDGEEYIELSKANRRLKRWKLSDEKKENVFYKATHVNHPSAIWVRDNAAAYTWTYNLFAALCDEYTYRYGKVHLTDQKLRELLDSYPWRIYNGVVVLEPPQCMPAEYQVTCDTVQAYQNYYIFEKAHMCVWTKRAVPDFMVSTMGGTAVL